MADTTVIPVGRELRHPGRPGPVFVDPTGRRGRAVRIVALAASFFLAGVLFLLATALFPAETSTPAGPQIAPTSHDTTH